MIGYSKKIEKIIRGSAFNKKKKTPGLKVNPGLALTGVRTTGPALFFFLSKAFSRTIFSILFRVANHQIVHKKK